jgi:hypothetical protein
LVGTILEPLQERPERRHLAGLPRPGKTKALRKSAGVSNFVQTLSDNRRIRNSEQRLGADSPALLPVKPILQVSGPSRGWLSVWGSFSCFETRRYAAVGSGLRMPKMNLTRFHAGDIAAYINKLRQSAAGLDRRRVRARRSKHPSLSAACQLDFLEFFSRNSQPWRGAPFPLVMRVRQSG